MFDTIHEAVAGRVSASALNRPTRPNEMPHRQRPRRAYGIR
jgi:hypothetical protein